MPNTEERLIMLQGLLDGYIKAFDSHITEFKNHELEERDRWAKLLAITETNAKSVCDLTEATRGVVEAWQTSANVGRFVKWLSGFAVLGAAYTWWIKNFPFD